MNTKTKFSKFRHQVLGLGLAVTLIAGGISSTLAQTPAPAAPEAPAPAAAPAAPATPPQTVTTLDKRVSDLENYISDAAPSSDGKLAGVGGPGHNAWMMTSSALVLFMTLPGLALFYGGLVRKKNVLSVLAQCFGITGLVSILWWACGFSIAFSPGTGFWGHFFGGLHYSFFKDVTGAVATGNWAPTYWVSLDVFAIFQLTFAIITPALIVGSIAERMKFSAVLVFIFFWMFIVYFPLAHMVWSTTGWMSGAANTATDDTGPAIKAIDFAGGTVVHMSSGYSALVLALLLGKRQGWGKDHFTPHSMVLCMIGTGMLWVGWYGFNAGSEVGSDGTAANAFTTTTLATATASFVWPLLEWILKGKPSVLGFCSGAVAGLVVITPACGWITPNGSMIVGVAAAVIPYFAVTWLKPLFGYDDALDTFGVHAIGGTVGAILTGLLCDTSINSLIPCQTADKLADHHAQVIEQLKAVGVTIALAVIGTLICALLTKIIVRGLRVSPDVETTGLDIAEHGEEGYIL